MENLTITINTSRDQIEAYIEALSNQINDGLADREKLNDVHCLAHLLKSLAANLPGVKKYE